MENHYRIKVRKDDYEFEIESKEKEFIENNMSNLLKRLDLKPNVSIQDKPNGEVSKKDKYVMPDPVGEELDIAKLIEFIKDQSEFPFIEENVLNKSASLPRILMCLYYADQFYNRKSLNTGQIESITDQFGVKILSGNASRTIKKHQKFFVAEDVRRRGTKVPYKINRAGMNEFAKMYLQKE